MKAKLKRTAFVWSTVILVTAIVFYLAKPFLSADYRSGLVGGCAYLWSWFVAKPFAQRAWPDVKKGWAE